MEKLISQFFEKVKRQKVDLYNEFSFQHELGIFLREHISDYKIQFERNISYFGFSKDNFEKKEIDISIFNNREKNCVLELKYPRNGQVPETMYNFCKDISFLEQLSKSGFKSAYFIAIVDDPLFYLGNTSGIYGLFRGQQVINGLIFKPTGAKNTSVNIQGQYTAKWEPLDGRSKYCVIKIGG